MEKLSFHEGSGSVDSWNARRETRDGRHHLRIRIRLDFCVTVKHKQKQVPFFILKGASDFSTFPRNTERPAPSAFGEQLLHQSQF